MHQEEAEALEVETVAEAAVSEEVVEASVAVVAVVSIL